MRVLISRSISGASSHGEISCKVEFSHVAAASTHHIHHVAGNASRPQVLALSSLCLRLLLPGLADSKGGLFTWLPYTHVTWFEVQARQSSYLTVVALLSSFDAALQQVVARDVAGVGRVHLLDALSLRPPLLPQLSPVAGQPGRPGRL